MDRVGSCQLQRTEESQKMSRVRTILMGNFWPRDAMELTDAQIAEAIIPGGTASAVGALIQGVYLARTRNQELSSLHFLYGLTLVGDEAIAASILQLNECDLFRLRKASLEASLPGSTFSDDMGAILDSLEIQTFSSHCFEKSEYSRDCLVNTAHMLSALFLPELRSREVLAGIAHERSVLNYVARIIHAQDRRFCDG